MVSSVTAPVIIQLSNFVMLAVLLTRSLVALVYLILTKQNLKLVVYFRLWVLKLSPILKSNNKDQLF